MKNLIIIILLCAGISQSKAQVIDTAFHSLRACRVAPMLINPRTDSVYVTHIGLQSVVAAFNIKTIYVYYQLCKDDGTVVATGAQTLTGASYVSAMASLGVPNSFYFFTYLATKIPGLTYQ